MDIEIEFSFEVVGSEFAKAALALIRDSLSGGVIVSY
jgi:hypothetical protein